VLAPEMSVRIECRRGKTRGGRAGVWPAMQTIQMTCGGPNTRRRCAGVNGAITFRRAAGRGVRGSVAVERPGQRCAGQQLKLCLEPDDTRRQVFDLVCCAFNASA
jgi:hypothetical protein